MTKNAIKFKIIKERKAPEPHLLSEIVRKLYSFAAKGGSLPEPVKAAQRIKTTGDNIFSFADRAKDSKKSLDPLFQGAGSPVNKYIKQVDGFLEPPPKAPGQPSPLAKILNAIDDKVPNAETTSTAQGRSIFRNLTDDLSSLRQGLQQQRNSLKELLDQIPQGSRIQRGQIDNVLGKIDDAIDEVEATSKQAVIKATGLSEQTIDAAIAQAKNLDTTLPVAKRNLDDVDGVIDLLPGGATAPEVVLALPAPQQAKVSGAIDDIIEAEVLALGAPPPKGVPDIPPQIFTLPEKSKKLEKLFKYAAAAGLTTGLIVVLAKADPSGALATILGVSSDGKTSKTGSAGSGGNAKARRTRIAHANVKAKTPEDSVKTFQNLLIKQGYRLPRFGADGDYGDETVGAVKAFQGAKGLKVDGVVGKDTWAALSGKKAATVNKLKPKDVVTQNTAKKTEVTINQLITRMRNAQDKNGNPSPKIQQTINAYVDFRDRLVTKLKIIAGSQNLTQSSRAGLYKIVDKTFPPVPTGKAATQYTFVTGKFRELPDKILTGQAVFGDVGIRPKQVLALAIKILKEYEQQDLATNQGRAGTDVSQAQTLNQRDTDTGVRMPNDATKAANRDPNRTRTNPDGTVIPESKSYNIDFSKWKPMIKNSY